MHSGQAIYLTYGDWVVNTSIILVVTLNRVATFLMILN